MYKWLKWLWVIFQNITKLLYIITVVKLLKHIFQADLSLLAALPPARHQYTLPNGIDHTLKRVVNGEGGHVPVTSDNLESSGNNDLIWLLRVQLAEALNLQVFHKKCLVELGPDYNIKTSTIQYGPYQYVKLPFLGSKFGCKTL